MSRPTLCHNRSALEAAIASCHDMRPLRYFVQVGTPSNNVELKVTEKQFNAGFAVAEQCKLHAVVWHGFNGPYITLTLDT